MRPKDVKDIKKTKAELDATWVLLKKNEEEKKALNKKVRVLESAIKKL